MLNQIEDDDHKEGLARFMEMYISQKNCRVSAAEGKRAIGWGEEDFYKYNRDDDSDSVMSESSDNNRAEYIRHGTLYIRVSKAALTEYNKPWLI